MKPSRKLLALVVILAMMTCSFAKRGMGPIQTGAVEKGTRKISSLGGTSIDNHHSIPRDQYNSHGGSTGDNGDDGSGIGGTD